MKKQLQKLMLSVVMLSTGVSVNAQIESTFDDLTLNANSYWNGSSQPLGTTFTSGDAIFQNYYDTAWGGYWSAGFAYSNMTDSTTAGYTNMYSAITAQGFYGSPNYVVGMNASIINLNTSAIGKMVNGLYVTNSTYAAIAMRDGDMFARKFGDTTGTNSGLAQGSYPDWFKLTIIGYQTGTSSTDTVEFYLADYRFANDSQDYIVKNWEWVDLTSLGNVDSLMLTLSSSDMGAWGMNTPAFFCIDNFTTANTGVSVSEISGENTVLNMYPNPATDMITVDVHAAKETSLKINVTDVTGKLIYSTIQPTDDLVHLNISNFDNGIYFINVVGEKTNVNQKFIKH